MPPKRNNKYYCSNCNKEFVPSKTSRTRFNNGTRKHIFCSKECRSLFFSKKEDLVCKNCGEQFKRVVYKNSKNTFCSRSCSAKYSNRRRQRKRKGGLKKICPVCGKEFKASSKSKYCSTDCSAKGKVEENIKKWKEGKISGYQPSSGMISCFVKKYLLEKANYKCERCGFSSEHPITKKTILQVNHIDGNYKNCKEENLEILCPNCHALTPTFGALNKGSGRKMRNKK